MYNFLASDGLLSQGAHQIASVDYAAPTHRARSLPRAQSPAPSAAIRKSKAWANSRLNFQNILSS